MCHIKEENIKEENIVGWKDQLRRRVNVTPTASKFPFYLIDSCVFTSLLHPSPV